MIVISRNRDDAIIIGDNIEIVVVDIRDDKVRLGFSMPKEMPLHRGEVYEALRRHEKQEQSKLEPPTTPASDD